MSTEVAIPDIGDAENVEVIEICVAPGDEVAENDALIVVESDKASMEVPSPLNGTVVEVLVALSDRVNAGDPVLRLQVADADSSSASAAAQSGTDDEASQPAATDGAAEPQQAAPAAAQAAAASAVAPASSAAEPAPVTSNSRVYAGPAVRRLARELGVNLAEVAGSGSAGRIVKDDVKAYVKSTLSASFAPANLAPIEEIDFSRFGEVDRQPLTRVRARGATNLHRSWQHVVHVTQHEDVDVTDLEAFRQSLGAENAKPTPLPFIVKACIHALRRHPQFNASLNPQATELIVKRYYHIGIAVDTEDGLLVPVLRDADKLGVFELAQAIARLSAAARERKLRPDELQGGSFTVSSLGAIGGTGFTPIVNAPEVAILGVGRMDTRPLWDGAAFQPRKVLPLSLSYDHRAVNGAEAGRFVADLKRVLGDIRRLAL